MFDLPDKGTAQNDIQSILFSEYLDVLLAGVSGTECVLSGCAVTAQVAPDMTVAVAKGAVLTNSILKPVTAGNVTVTTADGTNARLDLIVVDSSGAKQVRTGTAAAAPKPPARSANDVVLAVVYVPAADTTISTDQVTDLRMQRTTGPIVIYTTNAAVTFNTTSTAQTYFTLTIPDGLLLTDRIIRVRMGGTALFNSGTPTLTLIIKIGGSTIYQNVTTVFSADADRRVWSLQFDLIGESSAAQKVLGYWFVTSLTAFTGATTGFGGLFSGSAYFYGTETVNMDSADRDLVVRFTMNVSNMADEIVLETATAELV